MPSDTKTRTILLADLVGSTSKLTLLETEQGADFIHDATQPIEDAITEHEGMVIKFTGDGYIGTFESADDALQAADDIRNHFLRQRYTPAGIMLDGVRIVINTADIVLEENDIVGDGIIVAARLEKNVPTNHIWVTAATREVCSSTSFGFTDVGEIQIRGRARPVHVYEVQGSDTNYMEENIVLLVTDLHRYKEVGETLSPSTLNDWLLKWHNLHREAVRGVKGRVRQFVADMALLTFSDTDEAFHALLNLQALVKIHNEKLDDDLPSYTFKAAVGRGDLILSPTGVVGALVNRTFEVLNLTPRARICLSSESYEMLKHYRGQVEAYRSEGETFYLVKVGIEEKVD